MEQIQNIELNIDWGNFATRGSKSMDEPELFTREKLQILGRENRLELAIGEAEKLNSEDGKLALLNLPLRLLVHAHPECRFKWVRLELDFSNYSGAKVEDLVPAEVKSDPVKISTKYTGGLSFEVAKETIKPSAGVEYSKEYQIYFPEISGVGKLSRVATWSFMALPEQEMFHDRELKVLVSAVPGTKFDVLDVKLEAKLKIKGLRKLLPLFGSKRLKVQRDMGI